MANTGTFDAGKAPVNDLVVRVGGTVAGRLVDPEDKPVAGRPLMLISLDLWRFRVGKTTTDAAGRFLFTNIGVGEHVILAGEIEVGRVFAGDTDLRVVLPAQQGPSSKKAEPDPRSAVHSLRTPTGG